MNGFKKAFLAIAIPVTLQYLLRSSLNLIDTIMVGQLGDVAIASVGIGNQVYFLMNLFLLGISSGMGIFIAQFYGKKDYQNIKTIVSFGLLITLLLTGGYTFFVHVYNTYVMRMFSVDLQVINLGATYLKVVSLSYVITGITVVFSTVTRGTGKAKIPMLASFAGVIVNTGLNYLLIFGIGVFPVLGVKGAAIATVVARLVESVIIVTLVYMKHKVARVYPRHLFTMTRPLFKRFLSQSSVIIVKDVIWGVGVTCYIAIYARMGTESVASVNIVNTIKSIAFVLLMGIANAGIVMVGQQLGAGHKKRAYQYAIHFQKITLGVTTFVATWIMILRPVILSPFKISEQVYENTYIMLLVFACFFVLEGFNMVSVMGILRSGADNKFCLYMDLTAVWLIGFPLAFITGLVFKWPIYIVFGLVLSQELFKAVLLFIRVRSRKWMNNIVRDL